MAFGFGRKAQAHAPPSENKTTTLNAAARFAGVPVHQRIFIDALLGRTRPVTEADFGPQELDALREVVATARGQRRDRMLGAAADERDAGALLKELAQGAPTAQTARIYGTADSAKLRAVAEDMLAKARRDKQAYARGTGTLNYGDYGVAMYGSDRRDRTFDTIQSVRNTIGSAAYKTQPGGRIQIEDTYDFSNANRDPEVARYSAMRAIPKLVDVLINPTNSPYNFPNRVANAYIGSRGIPVKVTIPLRADTRP